MDGDDVVGVVLHSVVELSFGCWRLFCSHLLNAAILGPSNNSHLKTGTSESLIMATQFAACLSESKTTVAAITSDGTGWSLTVTDVMTPSVPSDPIKSDVKSYPAEFFGARVPVFVIVPSAKTHSSANTLSRIVPYRTAVVPDAEVAAIPPMVASAPGSTTKFNPVYRNASFNVFRVTPAPTVAIGSSMVNAVSDSSACCSCSPGKTIDWSF
mmetsp:Transcript_32814/g.79772  ORF Transcript_32814/g.79772 Transcript_32814/m.79772 type:complete len:212 (-) Transcript_32814:596-1231(-)